MGAAVVASARAMTAALVRRFMFNSIQVAKPCLAGISTLANERRLNRSVILRGVARPRHSALTLISNRRYLTVTPRAEPERPVQEDKR